jgi:hypothetical protein
LITFALLKTQDSQVIGGDGQIELQVLLLELLDPLAKQIRLPL